MRITVNVPLDVPKSKRGTYRKNYIQITHGTGRMMLFAGDQKAEHLNGDFYGPGIPPECNDPEHLFRIASHARITVFATQIGLIARYGPSYKKVPYLVKLNSKSNLVKSDQKDPLSKQWVTVDQIMQLKKNGLNILGVGYTIYLGSEYEVEMLVEAAQIIQNAHKYGLIAVIWIYPRGKAVKDEKDPHLCAGATGVAACLGADFVKVNYPVQKGKESKEIFKEAIGAAGRTRVICAGGAPGNVKKFLQDLHDQIYVSGASGNATGRNIHQKSLDEAINMCNAIYSITIQGLSVDAAYQVYKM